MASPDLPISVMPCGTAFDGEVEKLLAILIPKWKQEVLKEFSRI
jgi:hypothetical protein